MCSYLNHYQDVIYSFLLRILSHAQLSELRPYLPRMQPSTLLRGMQSSSSRSPKDKEEHKDNLDQQVRVYLQNVRA